MNNQERIDNRLPNFLLIGAMKAGTTSLCADLQLNSQIFVPSVKEPHCLCDDEVLTARGRRSYSKLFANAKPSQLCGEASTGYTKLPDIPGVPQRARQLLGAEARFVFLVRNPIDRAISHHYHMLRAGDLSCDIDHAIRHVSQLIDYGCYAAQLEPWLDVFDIGNFSVVRFEDYVADRRKFVADVTRFLGIPPEVESIDLHDVKNQGTQVATPRRLIKTVMRRVTRSQWYKIHVHPRTPQALRDAVKPVLMRKPAGRPDPPSRTAVEYLIEKTQADSDRLCAFLNRSEPLWDFDHDDRIVAQPSAATSGSVPGGSLI